MYIHVNNAENGHVIYVSHLLVTVMLKKITNADRKILILLIYSNPDNKMQKQNHVQNVVKVSNAHTDVITCGAPSVKHHSIG
jgi:hypothetical protein